MKNIFFLLVFIFIIVASCRKEEPLQNIDQIIHLYIDSLGQDMLNKNIPGSYFSVSMNDVDGATDNAPVTVNLKKNADTVSYIEYIAGATRLLTDSVADKKMYRSRIALQLFSRINDSTQSITRDTLILYYTYTPEIFQVSSALYNQQLVFTKQNGQPNVIRIHK